MKYLALLGLINARFHNHHDINTLQTNDIFDENYDIDTELMPIRAQIA